MQIMPSFPIDCRTAVIGDVLTSSTWREPRPLLDRPPIGTLTWQLTGLRLDRSEETSVVQSVERLLSWLKAESVQLGNVEGVRRYLTTYSELIGIIPCAILAIRKYLPQAHLYLDLYEDPEIEDEHLIVYVRLTHYDEDTMLRIQRAREEYRPLFSGKGGWLFVTTDFRQPEG